MDLQQPLIELVTRVDGATGAILADSEGEEITSWVVPEQTEWTELTPEERQKLIGAYQTIQLNTCRQIMQQFQQGEVRQLICRYDVATVLARAINNDYALILTMQSDGNVGKGMYYLNQAAELIRQDL